MSLLLLFKCVAHYEPFLSSGTFSHNMVKMLMSPILTAMQMQTTCTQVTQKSDVIKWKHLPRYWPLQRGNHRSPVNPPPHKSQWRGTWMFSLICARLNGWVNSREVGDLRRYRAHYEFIGMMFMINWHPLVPATTLLVKIMILMTGPSFCMAAEIKQFRKTYKYNFIFVHVDINNYRHKSVPLQEILRGRFVNLFFISESKLNNSFPNSNSQFDVEGYTIHRQDKSTSSGGASIAQTHDEVWMYLNVIILAWN